MQAAAVLIQPTARGRPLQVGLIGIEQGQIVLLSNQGNHKLMQALATILGWGKPYTVRYASNLDDGPNHGMPLGGFGAGCFGRAPDGNINLWHLDGGEHWFGVIPDCCLLYTSPSPRDRG